jgi:hypothetical protein
MNHQLSKREKTMLYILASFLIAALGISFLILPAISQNADLRLKLHEAQAAADDMRQIIERMPQDQIDLDTLKEDIVAYAGELYEPMTNDKVDQLITNMMIRYSLTPIELKIQALDTDVVTPYLSSATGEGASSTEEGTDATEPGEPGEGAESLPETPICIYSVTVQAEGLRSNFYGLADEVSGLRSMRMVSFDVQEDSNDPTKDIVEMEFAVITYAR